MTEHPDKPTDNEQPRRRVGFLKGKIHFPEEPDEFS